MKYLLMSFLTIILIGCNNGSEENENKTNTKITYKTQLSVSDIHDQDINTFIAGETIRAHISISSDSSNDETLKFNSSQFYDLYITNSIGEEVWRQSNLTTYSQGIREHYLFAGNKLTFRDDLSQDLFEGGGLQVGTYTLNTSWIGYGDVATAEFVVKEY